jgi:hypothetical protein
MMPAAARKLLLDRLPLILEVVPEQEVIVRRRRHDLGQLRDSRVERPPLLARRIDDAERGIAHQPALAVLLRLGVGDVGLDLVPVDVSGGFS